MSSSPIQLKSKVAIVYHFFANYRKPILERLAKSETHDFLFVADSQNRIMPGVKTWQPDDAKAFRHARCFPLPGGFMIQMGLLRLAIKKEPQCIILLGDWKWPSTWLSASLARIRGKRVLFWTHGWRTEDKGIRRLIRTTFYRLSHGLLLYGHRAKQIAVSQGFDPQNVYVVFNSLDYDAQVKQREKYNNELVKRVRQKIFGDHDVPVVICSARLHKRKKLSQLFHAIDVLKKRGKKVNVILIGDGDDKQNLESLAKELSIKVHFEGSCFEENRVAELTMASNLTVSPGPIGLTAIQSLTYGVPVLTNNQFETQGPEHEAIMPGITGDFFETDDTESMAAKIEKWTDRKTIPEETRLNCFRVIDELYNPLNQEAVFSNAIHGKPAQMNTVTQLFNDA